MPRAYQPPEDCPVCGAAVPRGARACPECGADESTGWNEEQRVYEGLDLPDGGFDREKFLESEFGVPRKRSVREKLWLGVALVALAAVTAFCVFRNFPPHG